MEPTSSGHDAILFVHPRSPREKSEEFYRNPKYGEFWVGRRMTLEETEFAFDIKVHHLSTLEDFLGTKMESLTLRHEDALIDELVPENKGDQEFVVWLSEVD